MSRLHLNSGLLGVLVLAALAWLQPSVSASPGCDKRCGCAVTHSYGPRIADCSFQQCGWARCTTPVNYDCGYESGPDDAYNDACGAIPFCEYNSCDN